MNIKIALGIVLVGVVFVVIGFFLMRPANTTYVGAPSSSSPASSTPPVAQAQTTTAASAQPTITVGTPHIEIPHTTFASSSLVSTSTYPTISGTANVSQIGIIINNSKNIGVVGTSEVPVINGQWSYSCSVKLPKGSYTVIAFVGSSVTGSAPLTIH